MTYFIQLQSSKDRGHMIQAICFDFDGTLATFQGSFSAWENHLLHHLQIGNKTAFRAEFARASRREGHVTLANAIAFSYDALRLAKPDSAFLQELIGNSLELYASQVELLPKARSLLEYFSHLPKALITNGPADMQWAAIRKVGIEDWFQTIIVSGDADVAVRKPSAKIFQLACERLEVHRIGFTALSLPQLKILQEVITLSVFVPFAVLYMKTPIKLDYLWAALCIMGAVYFIFRSQ
jgi:FMN phosphatase YigB (HAD superfamily)